MTDSRTISPLQSEVARKHLGWTQQDLATTASIGRSTVRKFEKGGKVRPGLVDKLGKVFEEKGIEFIEGDGVKRRWEVVTFYRGFDGCNQFYSDVLGTLKDDAGDLCCVAKSQDLFLRALGVSDHEKTDRLEALGTKTKIKCLMPMGSTASSAIPFVEFRMAPDYHMIGSDLSFGYGNRYAHGTTDAKGDFIFCVFDLPHTAQNYRLGFMSVWNNAGSALLKTGVRRPR